MWSLPMDFILGVNHSNLSYDLGAFLHRLLRLPMRSQFSSAEKISALMHLYFFKTAGGLMEWSLYITLRLLSQLLWNVVI